MLLRDFIASYVSSRDISREYSKQIGWTVDRFERFLKRPALLTDLTDGTINLWLDWLIETGLARRTVRGQRTTMLCLWRAAHFDRLIDHPPSRIKKIACPRLIPSAEPPEKVAALIVESRKLTGCFQRSNVPRAEFWFAFIVFLWETGLRLGDALRVEQENIIGGVLVLTQHKTGWPLVCPLSNACLLAIEATSPGFRKRIFGDALSRGHIEKEFRKLAKAAGFSGGPKKIRKSGATAVEAATPGAAMAYLGHRTPGLAYAHYVDPRLIQKTKPSPPPLAG
jgi:integrase